MSNVLTLILGGGRGNRLAQPVNHADATQMGIFLFDRDGQIAGFEEKPDVKRLGYCIRNGIIIVPKGGEVKNGATV